jgi:hypothetical protein
VRAQIHQGDVDESLIERLPIGFAKDRRVLPLARARAARCASR